MSPSAQAPRGAPGARRWRSPSGRVALRLISRRRLRQLRHALRARLGRAALARAARPPTTCPIAPTPHPLVELLGLVLSPLGPHAVEDATVALGFLALSACGWVIYRLGAAWFGRAAGALAALIFLTRVPVLSYGVRAYVDLPYLLLVLGALLVESRHRRMRSGPAGAPVLALLALAGLLRPEAWAFSGLYWLYLLGPRAAPRVRARIARRCVLATAAARRARAPHAARRRRAADLGPQRPGRHRRSAVVADQHPAHRRNARPRDRHRQRARVHPAADRRDPAPARARRRRARRRAVAAVAAPPRAARRRRRRARGVVFAAFATVGLPINTRYAFLASAILCIFAGAGVFGWTCLQRDDPRRRWWMAGGRARAASRCSPSLPPSTAPRTANWTNSRASRASKANCSRSSTTTPSTCAADPSACPTTRPSRCSPST